jgi:hypothetical protein
MSRLAKFVSHRTLAISVFAVALSAASLAAQTGTAKPPEKMDHDKMEMMEPATGWKELDAFHELMAASWHPASGKNDLAPARAKAVDMAAAAKKWEASVAPKGCDSPKLKEAVTKVAAGSHEFASLVETKAADVELKEKLGTLHKTFETVEMGCKPAK